MKTPKTFEADKKTINYYNKNSINYVEKTFNLQLDEQWNEFIAHIKPKGRIIDIGCGSGRDMIKFQQLGFTTEGLEPSPLMAEIARQNSGSIVHDFPVENLTLLEQFDGAWACASLLHVHERNIRHAIGNILNSLKDNGCLYFSLKNGSGQIRQSDDRLFVYYDESKLLDLIKKFKNIDIIRIWTTQDAAQRTENRWLNCILKKARPHQKV